MRNLFTKALAHRNGHYRPLAVVKNQLTSHVFKTDLTKVNVWGWAESDNGSFTSDSQVVLAPIHSVCFRS